MLWEAIAWMASAAILCCLCMTVMHVIELRERAADDRAADDWDEWLRRTVAEDDPANGGRGILALTDCPTCDGYGIVESPGKWYDVDSGTVRLRDCPDCRPRFTIL